MARRDKKAERDIARERVVALMSLADAAVRSAHVDRAHRYADLAWRVKTKYQLRRTGAEPRICRACHGFLSPGSTSRVRLTGGKRTTTCLRCGAVRRKLLA
jgi:ribonuclease P protein subunit RPR2